MDATAQAELVRSGEATPAELVEAAIARVEATNAEINAVIHPLFEQGLEAAAARSPTARSRAFRSCSRTSAPPSPASRCTSAWRYLKERDFRAPVDTYLAQRFRAAGLVTIGKTNSPELGILPTTEPRAYGATRNPWDPARSPGGSSGGSAAAVAAGMVPMAHANDGGGSIRIPAANCGLVGLKPSRQRISEGPLVGDFMSGLTAELVRLALRPRHRRAARRRARSGARRPLRRAAAASALHRGGRRRPGQAADRALDRDVDRAGRRPRGAWPPREAAREAARSAAATRSSEPDLERPRQSIRVIEPFLVRWAAGQAQALDQLGMVGGQPIGARRRRAADLGAGRDRPRPQRRRVPGRGRSAPGDVAGCSPASTSPASTCC